MSLNRVATGAWARSFNFMLGIWLFLSAFLWPHVDAAFGATIVFGLLSVFFTLLAMYRPVARFLNTLLAIVLLLSALAFATEAPATAANNGAVAVLIFALSWVRPPADRTRTSRSISRRVERQGSAGGLG